MKRAVLLLLPLLSFHTPQPTYRCKPCGHDCDQATYSAPGTCGSCHMPLVDAATIKHSTIAPEDVCAWIKAHPKALLVDVRTADEFIGKTSPNYGTLKKAINIPIQELEERMRQIVAYKSVEILVYCSHSHRSSEVSYALTQKGFKYVTNLAGGMSAVTDKSCVR